MHGSLLMSFKESLNLQEKSQLISRISLTKIAGDIFAVKKEFWKVSANN